MKTSLLLLTAIVIATTPSCMKQKLGYQVQVEETHYIWFWQSASYQVGSAMQDQQNRR